MAGAMRHARTTVAVISAIIAVTACGGSAASTRTSTAARIVPERILPAPKRALAAAEPRRGGFLWVLAGGPSSGLFKIDSRNGDVSRSVSVSGAAHSVAQSAVGIIGLALGTDRAGALELLNGRTSKVVRTVRLPAPATEVVLGSDGSTFYVLSGWASSASVTIVNSHNGKILGTIPVPADAVSFVPDVQQAQLYVLGLGGEVTEISIADHQKTASFSVGNEPGRSLAMSPDGSTLYVLKGTDQIANVAVVNVATESVHRVLPAPSHCLEVLTSASGSQLYEIVGTADFGNIQILAV